MSGVNKVILVGRLGQDPELRSTTTGHQVCTLNIATSETWTKDGNREERTEWHRVVMWDKQAELAQKYLKKGRMVYIEGKLQTRSWQDQQGQKRYTTEVQATSMQFIDGGGQGQRENTESGSEHYSGHTAYDNANPLPQNQQSSFQGTNRPLDDDIPF